VSSPGTYFTGRENACLDNCAKRFLDTTQFVIKYYQSKAGRGQNDSLDEFS
jgi:import inner membrane translocase subunit TIM8